MIVAIIILVCSFLLDGILSNFLPYMIGDLSLFTPMFTIVSLVIVYPFFIKKLRYYFIGCFAIGICYDFMYTNLLFYNAILFTIIGILVFLSRRPSGLRKTKYLSNSLAHRTTWLRSDLF